MIARLTRKFSDGLKSVNQPKPTKADFYLVEKISKHYDDRRLDRFLRDKFDLNWSLTQKLCRSKKLRVLRDLPTSADELTSLGYPRYEQITQHNTHLKENDRIVVHKDEVNQLNLEKAKAYRLPYYFKGDNFLE